MSEQPIIDKGPARTADRHGAAGTEAAEYFHLLREERAREFDRGYQLGRDLAHIEHRLDAFAEAIAFLTAAQATRTELFALAGRLRTARRQLDAAIVSARPTLLPTSPGA